MGVFIPANIPADMPTVLRCIADGVCIPVLQQLLNVTGNNLLDQMYTATPDTNTAQLGQLDVRCLFLFLHMMCPVGASCVCQIQMLQHTDLLSRMWDCPLDNICMKSSVVTCRRR